MSPARLLALLVATLACLLLPGCPPDLQPPAPDGGRVCATNDDCNPPGVPCGELYLCVQSICEATPSVVMPCR
jgi:hypothetical protein